MKKPNPHFFRRNSDRSVRVRIRFTEEEADLIEDAAGSTPLMTYIHQVINSAAQKDAGERREQRRSSLRNP